MPTPGNSLLLDTSVVVKHFRYPTAVVNKLAEYEELCLPQPALGELYYGAFSSGRHETSLAQIERITPLLQCSFHHRHHLDLRGLREHIERLNRSNLEAGAKPRQVSRQGSWIA